MRKHIFVGAIVAALAVPVTAARGSVIAPTDSSGKVLNIAAQYDFFQNVSDNPLSPTAPNPGDSTVEHGVLRAKGSRVGSVFDSCVFIVESAQLKAFGVQCQDSFVLGQGTIETVGVFTNIHPLQGGFAPDPYDEAITGGTGKYGNARGWVHIVFTGNEDATFTFHLSS